MESALLPVDALDEPLLLRHQESEDALLDLGEERDGLLEVGRVLLELLLQQVPERLVHDLLHLRLERGRLLLRLQILSKLQVGSVRQVMCLAHCTSGTRTSILRSSYRVAHLLRKRDMLAPNLRLRLAVNLSCDQGR